jgi:hypothetical protein
MWGRGATRGQGAAGGRKLSAVLRRPGPLRSRGAGPVPILCSGLARLACSPWQRWRKGAVSPEGPARGRGSVATSGHGSWALFPGILETRPGRGEGEDGGGGTGAPLLSGGSTGERAVAGARRRRRLWRTVGVAAARPVGAGEARRRPPARAGRACALADRAGDSLAPLTRPLALPRPPSLPPRALRERRRPRATRPPQLGPRVDGPLGRRPLRRGPIAIRHPLPRPLPPSSMHCSVLVPAGKSRHFPRRRGRMRRARGRGNGEMVRPATAKERERACFLERAPAGGQMQRRRRPRRPNKRPRNGGAEESYRLRPSWSGGRPIGRSDRTPPPPRERRATGNKKTPTRTGGRKPGSDRGHGPGRSDVTVRTGRLFFFAGSSRLGP